MQKNESAIPITKCGKYKQSIMDVRKWQVSRKQNSPLLQWFQWVIGN